MIEAIIFEFKQNTEKRKTQNKGVCSKIKILSFSDEIIRMELKLCNCFDLDFLLV